MGNPWWGLSTLCDCVTPTRPPCLVPGVTPRSLAAVVSDLLAAWLIWFVINYLGARNPIPSSHNCSSGVRTALPSHALAVMRAWVGWDEARGVLGC